MSSIDLDKLAERVKKLEIELLDLKFPVRDGPPRKGGFHETVKDVDKRDAQQAPTVKYANYDRSGGIHAVMSDGRTIRIPANELLVQPRWAIGTDAGDVGSSAQREAEEYFAENPEKIRLPKWDFAENTTPIEERARK